MSAAASGGFSGFLHAQKSHGVHSTRGLDPLHLHTVSTDRARLSWRRRFRGKLSHRNQWDVSESQAEATLRDGHRALPRRRARLARTRAGGRARRGSAWLANAWRAGSSWVHTTLMCICYGTRHKCKVIIPETCTRRVQSDSACLLARL
jgi:hypothetical protein